MKNKQIPLIFVVGAFLSLNAFLISSIFEDEQNGKRQAVQKVIAARVQGFEERQLRRQENNGIDSNRNTGLHDIADNCDILAVQKGFHFSLNPFLKNSNDQTAGDIVDQKLSRFTKGSSAYENCAAIRSTITLLENVYIKGCDDTHAHYNYQNLLKRSL